MEKRPPPLDFKLMNKGRPELVTEEMKTDLPEILVDNVLQFST